jgi:hypothetical protein
MLKGRLEMLLMSEGMIVGTHIMKNHVHRNHTTLQPKFKKQLIYNCYVIIPWVLQLYATILLEIQCI